MNLKQKNIILGIGGGIAAYKCCELVRLLIKAGADVHCVLTRAGERFVTPLTLQTLSKNPVYTDLFNLIQEREIGHIALADRADLVLVAPATADILAKVSHGLCDDMLTTLICATKAPVIFAPSMNATMWMNPITRENVERLTKFGYAFIEPGEGELACGYEGKGRLPEPMDIVKHIEKRLVTGDS
jgi:phosphopantothenoylcysteine decarboxylase/phosphopantothenate--cysteine ligase